MAGSCGTVGAEAPNRDIFWYWVCPACGYVRMTSEMRAPACPYGHGPLVTRDPRAVELDMELTRISAKSYSSEEHHRRVATVCARCTEDPSFWQVEARALEMLRVGGDNWV